MNNAETEAPSGDDELGLFGSDLQTEALGRTLAPNVEIELSTKGSILSGSFGW